MVKHQGEFIMVVLPASMRVDLDAIQDVLHSAQHPTLAEEHEFAGLFPDCETGAEPPFGNLYNLPVIVDEHLAEDPEIALNAGNHQEILLMA